MGSGTGDHARQSFPWAITIMTYITLTGYSYSTLPIIYLVHITITLQTILYQESFTLTLDGLTPSHFDHF